MMSALCDRSGLGRPKRKAGAPTIEVTRFEAVAKTPGLCTRGYFIGLKDGVAVTGTAVEWECGSYESNYETFATNVLASAQPRQDLDRLLERHGEAVAYVRESKGGGQGAAGFRR